MRITDHGNVMAWSVMALLVFTTHAGAELPLDVRRGATGLNELVFSSHASAELPLDVRRDATGLNELVFTSDASAELPARVELSDLQEGFAGRTGEILVIETSGKWHRSKFVNRAQEPYARGQLDEAQIAQLAEAIAASEFDTLPQEMGRDIAVNRHLIGVKLDDQVATIALRGGERPHQAIGQAKNWDRLLTLAIAIDEVMAMNESHVRVEARGKLIGTQLKTRELTFVLDAADMEALLESLQGKMVDAKGGLTRSKNGTLILQVTDIQAAGLNKQE